MRRFMNGVNRTWPHAGHRLYNTAKPGSIPEYFSACLLDHLPPDVVGAPVHVDSPSPIAARRLVYNPTLAPIK
jgi:hypothetical protein